MSKGRLVARNIATTIVAQVLSWGVTLGVTFFLPHYLGDVGLGKLSIAGVFAGFFGILVTLATSNVMVRDIARDHNSAGRLLLTSLAMRIPLGVLSVGVGVALGDCLGYHSDILLLILVGLIGGVAASVADAFSSALRGLEQFPVVNTAAFVEKVAASGLTIAAVLLKLPIWCIMATSIVSNTIASSVLLRSLNGRYFRWERPNWTEIKALTMASVPFLTGALFNMIYGKNDTVLLSKISSLAACGWYSLASRLAGTTMFLPVAITSAMYPTLSRIYRDEPDKFVGVVLRCVNLLIVCAVPFTVLFVFCPAPFVSLLSHNTKSFVPAIPVLQVWGGTLVIWFSSLAASIALQASDRMSAFSKIMGTAAAFSIPLTAGGIYWTEHTVHNGAIGAVIADGLTEVYLLAAYFRCLPAGCVSAASALVLLKSLVAAAPVVAVVYLEPVSRLIYFVVPAGVVYVVLCWLMRCFDPDDILILRNLYGSARKA